MKPHSRLAFHLRPLCNVSLSLVPHLSSLTDMYSYYLIQSPSPSSNALRYPHHCGHHFCQHPCLTPLSYPTTSYVPLSCVSGAPVSAALNWKPSQLRHHFTQASLVQRQHIIIHSGEATVLIGPVRWILIGRRDRGGIHCTKQEIHVVNACEKHTRLKSMINSSSLPSKRRKSDIHTRLRNSR